MSDICSTWPTNGPYTRISIGIEVDGFSYAPVTKQFDGVNSTAVARRLPPMKAFLFIWSTIILWLPSDHVTEFDLFTCKGTMTGSRSEVLQECTRVLRLIEAKLMHNQR
jgi:hypothetical protein